MSAWWKRGPLVAAMMAGAPLRAQTPTVTLEEAVALALRVQPAIIQARGDLDVAHAGRREALGGYLPSLSASSSLSQNSPDRWNPQTQQYITGQ
jgi:outer membrane protein